VLCDVIQHRDLPFEEKLGRAKDFLHLHYAFGHAKMETLETYRRLGELVGLRVIESMDISDQTLPTFDHWSRKLETNIQEVRALLGDEELEHFRVSCELLPEFWKQRILGYGLIVAVKE